MALFTGPKAPEEVFTPRQRTVTEMYVVRPELEERLKRSLRGTQHIVVHGESGTGKSWLYKKVLKDLDAEWMTANLANASRLGSITAEIRNNIDRRGEASNTGYTETKQAGVKAVVAEGSLSNTRNYQLGAKEPFEASLEILRKQAGKKLACMVFDNLETIIESNDLMKELADLIILLDDERYAQYEVKILIVGVPASLRDYFNQTPARAPVANRLEELPEVSRMSGEQTAALVRRGFVDELAFDVPQDALDTITKHVAWVTDRIPQRIHEYCLELARIGEEAGRAIRKDMADQADRSWLGTSLSNVYSVVENLMNERETKVGRRNQVLYTLGTMDAAELRLPDVEEAVRREFPESTKEKALNISGMMADLASGPAPILRRSPKGDSYQFADPKYRMCIRVMLEKDPGRDQVAKRALAALL